MSEEDAKKGKKHVSVVIAGHVDAGKSTTTGRLIFELGGIPPRQMEKLREEAAIAGMESFCFAFLMDKQKEERARGVTITCTAKEFYTERYHYTIIDAPGHRDFIKNMITGSSQADVAILMVPADGNFEAAIAKGDHDAGTVPGQTRQHGLILDLLGITQLIVGVNKMDCDTAAYGKERYEEVCSNVRDCLLKVGWKKDFIMKSVPVIPISGWQGDNLIEPSKKMAWWTGVEVEVKDVGKIKVHTLLDALDKMVYLPKRDTEGAMRMPVSGVLSIKGVGTVITGCVERGKVEPGSDVVFLPTHTETLECKGRVFTVEMHKNSVPMAGPGDNVGINLKGLKKENMPKTGDVMILASDSSLKACKAFSAHVKVLDHPNELKVGYTPNAYVRTAHSAVRMSAIRWKLGKSTGKVKEFNPKTGLKKNDMAEVVFHPTQPFVVEAFSDCAGLGRVAIMEGKGVQMLGKCAEVYFDDAGVEAGAKAAAERAEKEAAAAPAPKAEKGGKDKKKKKEKEKGGDKKDKKKKKKDKK